MASKFTLVFWQKHRPRVSKKTQNNSSQWDQGIALQQGTPHKELRKELPIQIQYVYFFSS